MRLLHLEIGANAKAADKVRVKNQNIFHVLDSSWSDDIKKTLDSDVTAHLYEQCCLSSPAFVCMYIYVVCMYVCIVCM